MIGNLEMLSRRGRKEYAKEAQAVAATGADGLHAWLLGMAANRSQDMALVGAKGFEPSTS